MPVPSDSNTASRLGVLLVNLGSPEAPTPAALRRYLAQFLWDPRVVEQPRWLWWPVLHGVILRLRPRRSARAYHEVWTRDGAPLVAISRRQARALTSALQARFGEAVAVQLAMRYGEPSIETALQELGGIEHLLVLPLYPQYSATTTASVFDGLADALRVRRDLPGLHAIRNYATAPGYIAALAASVREHWQRHGQGQKLLMSFHGIPVRYVERGDPYYAECAATARLLAAALELPDAAWQLTFQSRFGPEPWLQPYTDATLKALPGQGIEYVDVICPGFAADCLETLEEIARQNRGFFIEAGGKTFNYIPALNDRPDHIAFLADLVVRHTRAWF